MDVEALTARIVAQGMEREGAARIAALLAPRLAALTSVPLSELTDVAPAIGFLPSEGEAVDADG